MRRSTVLSLPLQSVFPGCSILETLAFLIDSGENFTQYFYHCNCIVIVTLGQMLCPSATL